MWMGFLKRFSETCIFHQKKGKNFDRRKVVCWEGYFSFIVNTGEKKQKGLCSVFSEYKLGTVVHDQIIRVSEPQSG